MGTVSAESWRTPAHAVLVNLLCCGAVPQNAPDHQTLVAPVVTHTCTTVVTTRYNNPISYGLLTHYWGSGCLKLSVALLLHYQSDFRSSRCPSIDLLLEEAKQSHPIPHQTANAPTIEVLWVSDPVSSFTHLSGKLNP
eukprot:4826507-Amphidinium_carterae.1